MWPSGASPRDRGGGEKAPIAIPGCPGAMPDGGTASTSVRCHARLTHKQRLEGRVISTPTSTSTTSIRHDTSGTGGKVNGHASAARARVAEEHVALREQIGALTRQNYHIAKLNAAYLTTIRGLERRITELQMASLWQAPSRSPSPDVQDQNARPELVSRARNTLDQIVAHCAALTDHLDELLLEDGRSRSIVGPPRALPVSPVSSGACSLPPSPEAMGEEQDDVGDDEGEKEEEEERKTLSTPPCRARARGGVLPGQARSKRHA